MIVEQVNTVDNYENYFHKKGCDTINCPEYLKKTKRNMFSLVSNRYNATNLSVFCYRKITL